MRNNNHYFCITPAVPGVRRCVVEALEPPRGAVVRLVEDGHLIARVPINDLFCSWDSAMHAWIADSLLRNRPR